MSGKNVCENCLGGQVCRDSTFLGKINGYCLYRCPGCHLIYVFPKPSPSELDSFYANYHRQTHQYELNQKGEMALFRSVLSLLREQGAEGDLLDIGSSYGNFVALAQAQGFQATGLDITPEPCRYAREVLQVDVQCQSLAEARFPANRFAVITLLNVLEHVPDPQEVMKECLRIAQPGGLLVVVVPNFLLAYPYFILTRKLGFHFPVPTSAYSVPDHLSIFGARSLRRMLEDSGWMPISLANAPVISNPNKIKTLFKKGVKALGDLLAFLTAQHLIYGYSLLGLFAKPKAA
jgi:2-polyprenyl-3-methyl-5-hydroxy-6-metoxy-1,4-benzoquinol methylase